MYICICIYYENSPARRKRVLRFSFKSSRETIVRSNYHKKKKRESLLLLLLLLKSIACSLGMKDYIYVYIYLCICICIYVYIRIHLYTYRLASKTLWTDKKKKKRKMKKIRETIIGLLIIENHLSDILEKGYARVWIRVSMRIDCPWNGSYK